MLFLSHSSVTAEVIPLVEIYHKNWEFFFSSRVLENSKQC